MPRFRPAPRHLASILSKGWISVQPYTSVKKSGQMQPHSKQVRFGSVRSG